MPELRQNFATKEWVIMATERAKRPQEMVRQHPPRTHSSFSPKCPFCPGNQATTPPGVMRVPATLNGAWTVESCPTSSPLSIVRQLDLTPGLGYFSGRISLPKAYSFSGPNLFFST
jgi:galactose-1-phosphate uridylyltransferase